MILLHISLKRTPCSATSCSSSQLVTSPSGLCAISYLLSPASQFFPVFSGSFFVYTHAQEIPLFVLPPHLHPILKPLLEQSFLAAFAFSSPHCYHFTEMSSTLPTLRSKGAVWTSLCLFLQHFLCTSEGCLFPYAIPRAPTRSISLHICDCCTSIAQLRKVLSWSLECESAL